MTARPDRARAAPLGLGFFLPVIGFAAFAPAALFMLPLATLSAVASTRSWEPGLLAVIAGGFSAWWLATVGSPPEQVVRTAAVVGTIAFVVFTVYTTTSVTHRCLAAVAISAVAVVALIGITGRGFEEFRWWIVYRSEGVRTLVLSGAFLAARVTGGNADLTTSMERWLDRLPDLAATFFPGFVAVQLIGGLALAAFVAHRLGFRFAVPPAPFREFRFTDQIGWLAVGSVATMLWAPRGFAWMVAVNLVFVFAALYAVRGMAVLRSRWRQAGLRSWLLGSVVVVSGILLWRVTLAGLIVVGVADTGLDLRNRWVSKGKAPWK